MSKKIWLNAKFDYLREVTFGGKCLNPDCDRLCSHLHFAHIKPTSLFGRGRGKMKRYYNIKNNIFYYTLLCADCHKKFDNGEININLSREIILYK